LGGITYKITSFREEEYINSICPLFIRDKMNYRILINGKIIGYSELEGRDTGMGVFYGNFTPTPEYENYRAIFRLYIEAMILRDNHQPYEEKLNEFY
jgi:hypothetical protein